MGARVRKRSWARLGLLAGLTVLGLLVWQRCHGGGDAAAGFFPQLASVVRPSGPWELLDLLDRMEDHRCRGLALDESCTRMEACREVKERIAQLVRTGQMSLAEAAARFRQLDLLSRGCHLDTVRSMRIYLPHASEEEAYCRNVINFCLAPVQNDPEQAQSVRQRLEIDLAAHLARAKRR